MIPIRSGVLIGTLAFACAPMFSAQPLPAGASIQRSGVDSGGHIYLSGYLSGSDLPASPDVIHTGCASCTRGFLAKLTPSGDQIMWATYLDGISAIAVAADDTIYAAGSAASGITLPPLAGYRPGPASLYIIRLSSDGKQLLAGTWFGGNNSPAGTSRQGPSTDAISAMRLDAAGNVYVVGRAVSSDFPVTPGADHRNSPPEAAPDTCSGAAQFVAGFDPALSRLRMSARLASDYTQTASDLAFGPDGSLYVAGTMGTERGLCRAWPVLTRFSGDGSAVIYSAVAQTRSPMGAYAVAVDAGGNAYLAGDDRFWSVAEPIGWVEKFNPQGGSAGGRALNGHVASVVIGRDGDVVLLGASWPDRIPITPGASSACRDLVHDTFDLAPYVAKLNRATLDASYAGYLPSEFAFLGAPDSIVAAYPYSSARPFAVVPAGPPPQGTVTCTANAADYNSYKVAPGEIVSLFGNQIGPEQPAFLEYDATGKVATQLAGVSITAGGLPAPILYAASGQINAVLPFGLSPSAPSPGTLSTVRIEVRRDGILIDSSDKWLDETAPGAFHVGSTGVGFLAALNQDGSPNSPSNPAAAGEAISIFVTGLGAETPQPEDGDHPPLPATKPLVPATAYVNQQPAAIEYIGNAPTLVQGLVQINIRLPDLLPPPTAGQPTGTAYIGVGVTSAFPGATFGGTIAVR